MENTNKEQGGVVPERGGEAKAPKEQSIREVIEEVSAEARERLAEREVSADEAAKKNLEKEIFSIGGGTGQAAGSGKKLKPEEISEIKKTLKYLLDLAEKEGLTAAVNKAKKMKDDYILDTFHDIILKTKSGARKK